MSFAFQSPSCRVAWWLRLLVCQLVACFGLTLGGGSAWAVSFPSGSDEPAPMCDPDGASVAAGDDIPEVDRGHFDALPFDALPCEALLIMAGWRLDDPAFGCTASFDDRESPPPGPQQLPRPRCEGARELSIPFPERAVPALAMFDEGEGLAPSPGHSRGLFRPPVARA